MRLGDLVEKIISIVTFGKGKRIAKWTAKKMGKEDCGCDDRRDALNKIKIKRW
jgi:hypothetical protein